MSLSYAFDPPETPTGLMKLPPRKPVTEQSQKKLKNLSTEGNVSIKTRIMRMFEKCDSETLVDVPLLSYSYLEAGTIETIGCFVCFFWSMYYHYGVTPAQLVQNATKFTDSSIPGDIGLGENLSVICEKF